MFDRKTAKITFHFLVHITNPYLPSHVILWLFFSVFVFQNVSWAICNKNIPISLRKQDNNLYSIHTEDWMFYARCPEPGMLCISSHLYFDSKTGERNSLPSLFFFKRQANAVKPRHWKYCELRVWTDVNSGHRKCTWITLLLSFKQSISHSFCGFLFKLGKLWKFVWKYK